MAIRRTAGLEECGKRDSSILRSIQASSGEGQISADQRKPVFRKTRVGRGRDTTERRLWKKGKSRQKERESRVIFQELSLIS